MILSRIIDRLSSTCRYCGQKAGLLQRDHHQCRQVHQTSFQEMIQFAANLAQLQP